MTKLEFNTLKKAIDVASKYVQKHMYDFNFSSDEIKNWIELRSKILDFAEADLNASDLYGSEWYATQGEDLALKETEK